MNNIQLIIPMSGKGQRFVDAGYDKVKPFIEVDGIPIIKHVVNMFPGVTDISFICNDIHLKETSMRNDLLSMFPNCKIYEIKSHKKGPVHTVNQISEFIDDYKETIISYCDYGTKWDFEKFINDNREDELDGSIACYTGFHPHMLGSDNYAFCKLEPNGIFVEAIKEKEPFTDNKMNEYASNGTYWFKSGNIVKKYFKELESLDINIKGEYYISLVYNLLIRDKLRVGIFEIENMLQWGTPYDLEIYNSWSTYFSNIIKQQDKIYHDDNTTLILPMAGNGSRFQARKYVLPKPLLSVNEQPMIVQAVNCLPQCKNNIFITLKQHVKEFNLDKTLSDNYNNCTIISIDNVTKGQACTCELAMEFIDLEKPILISACDNGVYYDNQKYLSLLNDQNNDVIVWSFRNNPTSKNNPNMYSWMEVDENDNIKNVSCKKFIYDNPLKTHAIIGTMFFRKAKYFIDGLNKNYEQNITTNGEYYVDDIINQNIKSGLNVKVFEVNNYICWGTPDDYETYNYWRKFFNDCEWHPYKIELDVTYKRK